MSGKIINGYESLRCRIEAERGISASRCYQCGKCSAGCPLATEMDYPPSQLLRMLQIGTKEMDEKILHSMSIWLCLTCETCIARCPQEVDLPIIMDFLRQESVGQNMVNPNARDILQFHKAFLDSIQYTGRLFEMGLIADYKTRTGHMFQDVLLAPWMMAKGKLHLVPERVKNLSSIGKIFSRTIKKKEAQK